MLDEFNGLDAVIVGAGPAGCAAAYDLAHAGRSVLLLDTRTFPRPKACACGLTRKTLKALRYSVEPVIEHVCNQIVLQNGSELRVHARAPICATAVRERFDAFCLQQTLAAGAQLRKIDRIAGLRETGSGVELDITTPDGTETLRAAVLIGADGSNGQTRLLAETLGGPSMTTASPSAWVGSNATWYTRRFALEACVPYADLPAKLPSGGDAHDLIFDFSPLPSGYGWLFPKGDHINIGVGVFAPEADEAQLKSVTRELLNNYAARRLGVATLTYMTGQHLGMGGHAYVPRGRVLLTGDAAGLCDPLTGEGIHSAIISGQAAAAAVLSPKPNLAVAYGKQLRPLQQTLAFSHCAARAFYAEPERGFRAMRMPLLRSLILKTYADGLPGTRMIAAMARLVA